MQYHPACSMCHCFSITTATFSAKAVGRSILLCIIRCNGIIPGVITVNFVNKTNKSLGVFIGANYSSSCCERNPCGMLYKRIVSSLIISCRYLHPAQDLCHLRALQVSTVLHQAIMSTYYWMRQSAFFILLRVYRN